MALFPNLSTPSCTLPDCDLQPRRGLEALANASVASPRGFAPRDGGGGVTAVDGGGPTCAGGVRIAAGPPPSASEVSGAAGSGLGTGRWDRESRVDKRKVGVCFVYFFLKAFMVA